MSDNAGKDCEKTTLDINSDGFHLSLFCFAITGAHTSWFVLSYLTFQISSDLEG
jgi:hypothetical protein